MNCYFSYAEYRVYQYYIRPKLQNAFQIESYITTSTLDPNSFVRYHGGASTLEANLLRTWWCPGNTTHRPICTVDIGNELTTERSP